MIGLLAGRIVRWRATTRSQSGHWGTSRAELEKRILRLHKGGTGILKIGKTLGIGTGTVQRVLMEQPRALSTSASLERRLPLSEMERTGYG